MQRPPPITPPAAQSQPTTRSRPKCARARVESVRSVNSVVESVSSVGGQRQCFGLTGHGLRGYCAQRRVAPVLRRPEAYTEGLPLCVGLIPPPLYGARSDLNSVEERGGGGREEDGRGAEGSHGRANTGHYLRPAYTGARECWRIQERRELVGGEYSHCSYSPATLVSQFAGAAEGTRGRGLMGGEGRKGRGSEGGSVWGMKVKHEG